MMLPKNIVQIIKANTAKMVFRYHPEMKKILWGGEFWTDGYFINTVSKHGSEKTIATYVKNQGVEKEYVQLHNERPTLFD